MKILHTADWHLGKVFEQSQINFSLINEQKRILEKITKIADDEKIDIVVIAGDIFDSYNPPNEARALFHETILELSKHGERPVIVISGNHDSPEGLASIKPFTEKFGIFIHHLPREEKKTVRFSFTSFSAEQQGNWLHIELKSGESVNFYLLPFVSETRLNEAFHGDHLFDKTLSYNDKIQSLISSPPPFSGDHSILVSHIFVDRGLPGGSEKTLILGSSYTFETSRIPDSYSLVLLGHLHRAQQIEHRIFYSGSIFPMNVREIENSPSKYVSVFDMHPEGFDMDLIEILPENYVDLKKFETLEKALEHPIPEGLIFIEIEKPLTDQITFSEVVKKFKGKLLGITFGNPEELEDEYYTRIDPSKLSDRELFVEFYRKQTGTEPEEELIRIFLEIMNEVRNEAG